MENIEIITGSDNPNKIEGVKKGFAQMFLKISLDIIGCAVESGITDQPLSNEETLTGAFNRAKNCQKLFPDADYFCGIEAVKNALIPHKNPEYYF